MNLITLVGLKGLAQRHDSGDDGDRWRRVVASTTTLRLTDKKVPVWIWSRQMLTV